METSRFWKGSCHCCKSVAVISQLTDWFFCEAYKKKLHLSSTDGVGLVLPIEINGGECVYFIERREMNCH